MTSTKQIELHIELREFFKSCRSHFNEYIKYKNSENDYMMYHYFTIWLKVKDTYAKLAMLSKIARLVKEVKELRKENARLSNDLQEMKDEAYDAMLEAHFNDRD